MAKIALCVSIFSLLVNLLIFGSTVYGVSLGSMYSRVLAPSPQPAICMDETGYIWRCWI